MPKKKELTLVQRTPTLMEEKERINKKMEKKKKKNGTYIPGTEDTTSHGEKKWEKKGKKTGAEHRTRGI